MFFCLIVENSLNDNTAAMKTRPNKFQAPKLPQNIAHVFAQFAIWAFIVLLLALVAGK